MIDAAKKFIGSEQGNRPSPEASPECGGRFCPRRGTSAAGTRRRGSGLRCVLLEPIEAAVPAALRPVTLSDGLEYGLAEGHLGLAVALGKGDRDQGVMAAAAVLAIPGEGVDQALRFHDFAKHAALPKLAAAVVLTQARPPRAARSRVLLEMSRGETARAHPALRMCRIGPKPEDELARRVEHARDDEHPLIGLSDGAGSCGHASPPSFAVRANIAPDDRSSRPRSGGTVRASRRCS